MAKADPVRAAVLADRRVVRRALAYEADLNAEWATLRRDFAGDEAGRAYRSREIGVRDAMRRLTEAWREADRKARKGGAKHAR